MLIFSLSYNLYYLVKLDDFIIHVLKEYFETIFTLKTRKLYIHNINMHYKN